MDTTSFTWMIGLPLVSSPLIYLAGRLGMKQAALKKIPLAYWIALIVLVIAWVPFALAIRDFTAKGVLTYTLGTIALRLDGLSLLLSGLALGLGTLVVLYSGPYMAKETGEEKYYASLVVMIGAMIGLSCANDLFNLWVWFETMAISSYLLVAFYQDQPASLEAGVKYLVQSAAGSAMILLGIALVLAQTGTLDLVAIRAVAIRTPILVAAGGLFVIGFGVKVAFVPMHTWLPDAHAQAPSGISAMLSGVVIEAGLVALLRVVAGLAGVALSWGVLLMAFGVVNMLVGNLMALRQTQVKRLLAFSSLAHIGYIALGLGIAFYSGQPDGAQGGLFHVLTHGMMKGLAFLAAGGLLYALHTAVGSHAPLTKDDLNGAAKRYPLIALTLSIAVLGLGGLPPLAGFMSKWQIFVAGAATHNVLIDILVVFAALNSVLSLGYYAPLVNAMYREKPSEAVLRGVRLPVAMLIPLIVLAVLVLAVGLWPDLLRWLSDPAGSALMAAFGGK